MKTSKVQHDIRGSADAESIIIAIGGGKGGVGKSFISSNLGIFLANMGFNTVMLDLDLGAPNLHTTMGEPLPKTNFHDFLRSNEGELEAVSVATQFPKLRLISGANDHQELANITVADQSKLMASIYKINADFTILDLSAGTHTSTLDFFNMAHRHIITLTPDPTSIENAYRFMKAAFYRRIKRFERQLNLEAAVAEIMNNPQTHKVRVPSDLLNTLLQVHPIKGKELTRLMQELHFDLIVNQCRSSKDMQIADSIEAVSKKYFGVPMGVLGHINYDNAVWHSLRKRRALLLEFPNSTIYSQLLSIARDLASPHLKKAVV